MIDAEKREGKILRCAQNDKSAFYRESMPAVVILKQRLGGSEAPSDIYTLPAENREEYKCRKAAA